MRSRRKGFFSDWRRIVIVAVMMQKKEINA